MTARIVIFAKAPVPGMVKTRLVPALGAEGAAALAGRMLARMLREAAGADLGEPELCADPEPGDPAWEGHVPAEGVRLSAQGDGDLGDRLARAARRVIRDGDKVLLVGTDCPELDRARLREAARQLASHDAVIHPARDGGYALLGLTRFDPSVFSGIAWSGPAVAHDTVARIRALGWNLHIGDTLRDIDEPADLSVAGATFE